jgi:hypothetical protein
MSRRDPPPGLLENLGVVLAVAIIVVAVAWFSYQKGIDDGSVVSLQQQVRIEEQGYASGRADQRKDDLRTCQDHSIHPRQEDHCVAPLGLERK